MIPLTLLYTTLLPLALQLVLSIWYAHENGTATAITPSIQLPPLLTDHVPAHLLGQFNDAIHDMMGIWHRTDRIWAGTKLLGGMSAGFGLRVILPTRPWETTVIVLAGWGAASLVARLF